MRWSARTGTTGSIADTAGGSKGGGPIGSPPVVFEEVFFGTSVETLPEHRPPFAGGFKVEDPLSYKQGGRIVSHKSHDPGHPAAEKEFKKGGDFDGLHLLVYIPTVGPLFKLAGDFTLADRAHAIQDKVIRHGLKADSV